MVGQMTTGDIDLWTDRDVVRSSADAEATREAIANALMISENFMATPLRRWRQEWERHVTNECPPRPYWSRLQYSSRSATHGAVRCFEENDWSSVVGSSIIVQDQSVAGASC
jgi:hypothetical protein